MKEAAPTGHHLKHLKNLTNKFGVINAVVEVEDQVITLLDNFPDGYGNLVTALGARVVDTN